MINNDNLSLEEAIKEDRVFVLNKSKPKGQILITFIQPNSGKSFVATVPKTWIPIAVSDSVPLSVIQDSIDFRSYLTSEMLVLMNRKEAEQILSTDEAQEELKRIYTSKYAESGEQTKEEENEDNSKEQVQNYIQEENLVVKDILLRNKNSKTSVTLNELRSIEEELSENDLIYIIKHTEGKVRSWAEKLLKEMDEE